MENRFLALIEKSIKKHWELPVYSDHNGMTYHFKDMARRIEEFHILLEKAGIEKGDKAVLVGRNSSGWAMCFFGTLSYGAVVVPLLHDFKPDSIHYLVNHSEAKVVLVAGSNWESMKENEMPGVKLFLLLDDFTIISSKVDGVKEAHVQLDELFNRKYPDGFTPDCVKYHLETLEELAVLNYTSGTTSSPKGVMIPYRSLWSNTKYAETQLPFMNPGDRLICMLPMAHMYGLAFEILNSVNIGCHVHFLPKVPSPKVVIDCFNAIRPSLVLAVPLILEKIIRTKVFPQMEKPLIRFLLKVPLVNRLVKKKILQELNNAFGGNFFELVIGGAAINKEVETFLRDIGFHYTVGYGMTECGPLVAYEQWDTFKQGSVGRVVDRMEVEIENPNAEQIGEILVKGDNLMLGYYKNKEATDAVMMPDGWMRTGDLGTIDKDGFLYIRGRSKSMILSGNGQNIYPEELEDLLNNMPCVTESLIVSKEGKIYALIYPDWDTIKKRDIPEDQVRQLMQENINRLNRGIPSYSKVADFKLYYEEFEKTPKRSIKRFLYQQEAL